MSWQFAYSWSKSIDIGSTEYSVGELQGSIDNLYVFLRNLNRGVSDFDVPQHLSVNFLRDAPSPHSGMVVSRFLLSGWELSGIFTVQSGAVFNIRIPVDRAGTGSTVAGSSSDGQRPDFAPGFGCSSPIAVNSGNLSNYIKLQCFSFSAVGTLGNLGRNVLRGPSLKDSDFSLFKNHNLLSEKLKVQFRAEFFNLFNRTNFGTLLVSVFNSQGLPVPASAAPQPPSVTSSRQIQFGMKLIW